MDWVGRTRLTAHAQHALLLLLRRLLLLVLLLLLEGGVGCAGLSLHAARGSHLQHAHHARLYLAQGHRAAACSGAHHEQVRHAEATCAGSVYTQHDLIHPQPKRA